MSRQRYCPYCNHEIEQGECSNWTQCRYKGAGIFREDVPAGEGLGDLTGDPRNNGDYDRVNYD